MSQSEMIDTKRDIPKGYKLTKLGLIPKDWEDTSLKECCYLKGKYGINAPGVSFKSCLPTYLRITDIDDQGRFKPDAKVSVDDPESEKYYLEEGDIVFARTGNTTGKTYLYDEKDGKLVFAGFLIKFRSDPDILDSKFLSSYCNTEKYWNWVRVMSTRSGQPGINGNEYGLLPLVLPPLPEQQKIDCILSAWDRAIDKTGQLIAKKQERKKGLMQQLLTGMKRFSSFVTPVGATSEDKKEFVPQSKDGEPTSWKMKETKLGLMQVLLTGQIRVHPVKYP